jgi:hypothetical protein
MRLSGEVEPAFRERFHDHPHFHKGIDYAPYNELAFVVC